MSNDDETITLRRRRAIIAGSRTRTFVDAVQAVMPTVSAQLEERKSRLEGYWTE